MMLRLGGIQALRGVAALAVVIHHALEIANAPAWLTRLGSCGVDIFFVISGFVMAYSSQGLSAPDFFLRRLARIVPLYWLATLAMVALALSGLAFQSQDVGPTKVVRSLLFVEAEPVVGVGWTLNYEMFFYLLLAGTIAAGLFRAAALVIPLLLVATVVLRIPYLGSPIVLEFGFGMLLAAAFARGLSGRWALAAAAAAVAMFAATSALWPNASSGGLDETVRWFAWGAPATLAVYAALWWKPRGSLVGDASYSIYLSHVGVMAGLAKLLSHGPVSPWIAVPASILVSVAFGIVIYLAVERPLHRRTSAYFRARKARLTAQLAARPAD